MKRNKQAMPWPLVMIDWHDSKQACGTWRWVTDVADQPPVVCKSVGWLIREDKETKTLAMSLGDATKVDAEQCSGVMVIAASAVRKITKLG